MYLSPPFVINAAACREGYPKWLGATLPICDTVVTNKPQWRSFSEALEFVHSLGITSSRDWAKWSKSGVTPPPPLPAPPCG